MPQRTYKGYDGANSETVPGRSLVPPPPHRRNMPLEPWSIKELQDGRCRVSAHSARSQGGRRSGKLPAKPSETSVTFTSGPSPMLSTSKTKNPAAKCLRGFSLPHAPDRIRTCDLWLRRPTLYPAELRARKTGGGISRVLSRLRGGIISLGALLPTPSSSLPGTDSGAGRPSSPIWPCSEWGLPCHLCYQRRGALLPHRFTL